MSSNISRYIKIKKILTQYKTFLHGYCLFYIRYVCKMMTIRQKIDEKNHAFFNISDIIMNMNVIAVDIGSYSVKFLISTLNKKSLKVDSYREVLISKVRKDLPSQEEEHSLLDIQYSIVENFLSQNLKDHKVVFNISADYTTSRFLNLPVSNKKKANMMIPFQLDENIPYGAEDIHFTTSLFKDGNNFKAIINITALSFFEKLYTNLNSRKIVPNILTTQLSTIQSCLDVWGTGETVCILDLGHHTTQAFFFNKDGVISSHHSHIAGQSINQTISQSYDISLDEAQIYKHQNCFFLSPDQYDNVDTDQQEFAKLMAKSIHPLIQDLKRWIMGVRVKENLIVERIFITGGSSNINNIDHFLSSELATPVEFFDTGTLRKLEPELRLSFNQLSLMSTGLQSTKPLANFISGNFSTSAKSDVSLHSTAFMFTRTAALAFIFILSLFIERNFFLSPQNQRLDRLNKKLMKNETLGIGSKARKLYRKKAKRVLSIVKKKEKIVRQEINTIQSATKVNAMNSLVKLSKVLENNQLVSLRYFNNDNTTSTAIFESKNKKEIDLLSNHIKSSDLEDLLVESTKNKKSGKHELTVKYSGN